MLYIKHVMKEGSSHSIGVEYFCKFCGNIEPFAEDEAKLISRVSFTDKHGVEDLVGEDMIHDITLPHIHTVKCTNDSCTRQEGEKNDVILLRYDKNNSKYLYYCSHCQNKWKSGDATVAAAEKDKAVTKAKPKKAKTAKPKEKVGESESNMARLG